MASQPSGSSHGFQQRLGLFDGTMLVAGTMIGSGIFITSQDIANDVGAAGWLMVVWALSGVMTLLGAMSYAELAGMMPHAGGQYVYLKESYSPLWGFLYGWTCFLVIQTGSIAAVAVAFAKFLGVLVPMIGTQVQLEVLQPARDVAALFPSLADLGTDALHQKAIIVFAATNVNWQFSLPFMAEPFFEMKHFVVTAGQIVAVGVIVFLTWLNCRGVQEGKIVQNVMGVTKTLALIGLILVGLFVVASAAARTANYGDLWGGLMGTESTLKMQKSLPAFNLTVIGLMVVGGAMVGSLFSMDAWNNITFTAGEFKNPKRNLPLSLFFGTSMVIVLYLAANYAFIESLPVQGDPSKALEKERLADAEYLKAEEYAKANNAAAAQEALKKADQAASEAAYHRGINGAKDGRVGTAILELLSPRYGAYAMAIAIMISTFGCVNGMILMGARLYYVMAVDNLFFRAVGRLNRRGVPAVGLIFQSAWSILLVFSGTYNELLDYVIFAVLVFYVLTVIGLFILRRTQPQAERPYRAFGYPVLPAFYVSMCALVMVNLLIVKPKFTWPGLIIVLSGIPIYFLWRLLQRK